MVSRQDGSGHTFDEFLINSRVAHASRVYDYLLGGVVNFAADRVAAAQQAAAFGGIEKARPSIRMNRDFLVRAVRYLALEAGVRQFLDIGTGIPGEDNVHAVAQGVAPDARVVYVDHDPVVLAHAHELLNSTREGAAAFIHADLREPEAILKEAAFTLDLGKPVAIMLIALLHLIPDEDDPYGLVGKLAEAMPASSFLIISHMTKDVDSEAMTKLKESVPASAQYWFRMRSHAEVCHFFEGLELVEPGVVTVDRWRPDKADGSQASVTAHHYGGVGRKP